MRFDGIRNTMYPVEIAIIWLLSHCNGKFSVFVDAQA